MLGWRLFGKQGHGDSGDAPLPSVGEVVRLEELLNGRTAAHAGRLRATPYRKILIDLIQVNDDNAAAATFPTLRGTVRASFARGDALYVFDAKVIGSSRTGAVALQRPDVVTRVQRRQFFRMPIETATTFRMVTSEDQELQVGRILNISGGGALIAASVPMVSGSVISLRVPSGSDGEPINVPARILETIASGAGRARSYLLRAEFRRGPGFDEDTRDSLIAFIFQSQRAALKARKRA